MHCVQTELEKDAWVKELLSPISEYLSIPDVTEIVINEPYKVICEIGPEWHVMRNDKLTMKHLLSLATAIATYTDQTIDAQHPILSAMLPDGERVQIVVPPSVEHGKISITIRKPVKTIKSLEDYQNEGAFNKFTWSINEDFEKKSSLLSETDRTLISHLKGRRFIDFIIGAVRAKRNIAVVGDTGSGKTTLMKAICQHIPLMERLVTIEDVRELVIPHENKVNLLYSKGGQGVAKVSPADLISSCMRMKPDRVLLAELRGGEAFDFLKLLTTGHSGSITSYHAESCALATERYVFMAKEHEQAAIYDAESLKRLVSLTIDIIIHVSCTVVSDQRGNPIKKERIVSEIHFDPINKLNVRFGNSTIITSQG